MDSGRHGLTDRRLLVTALDSPSPKLTCLAKSTTLPVSKRTWMAAAEAEVGRRRRSGTGRPTGNYLQSEKNYTSVSLTFSLRHRHFATDYFERKELMKEKRKLI